MAAEPWDDEQPDPLAESFQRAIDSRENTRNHFYSNHRDRGEDGQDIFLKETIEVMEGTAKILQKILKRRAETKRERLEFKEFMRRLQEDNPEDKPDAS